jgi:histidinol-phosphate/aromatic aminotransferase/cobyric acid decarboxylase-like protein
MMNKQKIKDRIREMKEESGTHSPSIATILSELPELRIETDACFLSNPYATELFLEYLNRDLIETGKLGQVLEYYPPQNRDVSRHIAKAINVAKENIFVGNGAIEIIQAVLHKFAKKKIVVIIPTFSSYYEFALEDVEVICYQLRKDDNFELNAEDYVAFVKKHQPDTIVLINPNNPNGGYLPQGRLMYIMESCKEVETFIIDESFIHFAYEDVELSQISTEELIAKYPNQIVVKSMSKDFGIAGIRAGYAVMSEERVDTLLKHGYLWNVSGLADYFFKIYSEPEVVKKYTVIRKKYIMNTLMFLSELNSIKGIKTYPSRANFALVEILDGRSSFEVTMDLLIDHGVYVRDCSDKIGLEGAFLRVASRSFEENLRIIEAIKAVVNSLVLS